MRKINEFLGQELTIDGEIFTDEPKRVMYATDASAYREKPLAVVWPKNAKDLKQIIQYAINQKYTIIPRGAGTSLAGQVVGNGVVVDISRHMNRILEVNEEERWIRVEPGIVLDELNFHLKDKSLFFAPETSTSNRCVIGGMIGNNSSGLHSVVYGTTREHLISVRCILGDGSEAEFGPLTAKEFDEKCQHQSLEGNIYRQTRDLLSKPENRDKIQAEFPDKKVVRRNTGYALDELMDNSIFDNTSTKTFNFCKLIAGSEGTLAFITEAKLSLEPLPPSQKALVCAHFDTIKDSIRANLVALKHRAAAVELMDDKILELTKENIEQRKNRFFVKGDPGAILMIEFATYDNEELDAKCNALIEELKKENLGYHYPVVKGADIKKVWNLRKAGLGVLSNMPGDAKPVSVIEDTSVNPEVLEAYIDDFNKILKGYDLNCVYHAHISVGELHLRPILNLKDKREVELFYQLAEKTARLVKKYKGSLSGEHGDGRLRGEFIPIMVGEEVYSWLRQIKNSWDPNGVFNREKIVDTPPMNTMLRFEPGMETREIATIFDFSKDGGYLRSIEKCNGSGDCRKTEIIGGAMCPSYMATRDENTTTRARANILREYLTHSKKENPFDHREIYEVLDLCLSCKACKAECPSNVDMAKLKAEFLQHYYDKNGIPLRARLIAYITSINSLGSLVPGLFNFFVKNPFLSGVLKKMLGFAEKRSIPELGKISVRRWLKKNLRLLNELQHAGAPEVLLFLDEFTNYNDTEAGIKTIKLLSILGYKIQVPFTVESGRTFISKGLLRTAQKKANRNILILKDLVGKDMPLIGIEPSAILGFRDEYPELVKPEYREAARKVAENAFMLEEFIVREMEKGNIRKEMFTKENKIIKFHGHCQQKAIAGTSVSIKCLSIPDNYHVEEIPSGCCGMAGSFGYEKEHYDLSMKVGELVLFPAIRTAGEEILVVAPGTSCRHQIKDGTGRKALHPAEVLYDALLPKGNLIKPVIPSDLPLPTWQ